MNVKYKREKLTVRGEVILMGGSWLKSPFSGEEDGVMRTTLSFFSSTSLPLSFTNCESEKGRD